MPGCISLDTSRPPTLEKAPRGRAPSGYPGVPRGHGPLARVLGVSPRILFSPFQKRKWDPGMVRCVADHQRVLKAGQTL